MSMDTASSPAGATGQSSRDAHTALEIPLTVVVLTKNEERNLPACLASVAAFSDVIVVDSRSTDATVQIAAAAGARVIPFDWDGRYPKKKQWALDNVPARHDWILLLDADERPTPELVAELRSLLLSDALHGVGAIELPLRYYWRGRPLAHGHTVIKRAIAHRERARFPDANDLDVATAWEVEGHYQPETSSRVLRLASPLDHDDRDGVSAWFDRHNRYSSWEAALAASGRSGPAGSRRLGAKVFAKLPAKPFAFFVYAYIVKRGFLDGRHGFEYAVCLAHYYLMIDIKTAEILAPPT